MKPRCYICNRASGVVTLHRAHYCVPCAKSDGRRELAWALLRYEFGDDPKGYAPAVLKELAARNGVMDANELFAPAGKLTWAETRAREAAMVKPA